MDTFFKLILLTVLMLGVFAVLYSQGYMVFKSIRARTFIGSAKGNGATFTSCSGKIKRMIRFKADGTYRFILDAQLSKGDLSVELLDSQGQKLMELNGADHSASVTVTKGARYCLVLRFRCATGSYTLVRE